MRQPLEAKAPAGPSVVSAHGTDLPFAALGRECAATSPYAHKVLNM
ncbi:hypothetical protein ACISU4_16890 [Streptomyces wuyuanensis]